MDEFYDDGAIEALIRLRASGVVVDLLHGPDLGVWVWLRDDGRGVNCQSPLPGYPRDAAVGALGAYLSSLFPRRG